MKTRNTLLFLLVVSIGGAIFVYQWSTLRPSVPQPLPVVTDLVSPDIEPSSLPSQADVSEDSQNFFLEKFASMKLTTPDQMAYRLDYQSKDGTGAAHGFYWKKTDPTHTTPFFMTESIVSFPDGTVYCEDVQEFFPPEHVKGCLPSAPASTSDTDNRPLKAASGWKLVSGDLSKDCSTNVYAGNVSVSGWYVWDYFYIDRQWMLVLRPQDRTKVFSEGYTDPLYLKDAPLSLEKELVAALSEKPVKLTLKRLETYCEGAPMVSLTP